METSDSGLCQPGCEVVDQLVVFMLETVQGGAADSQQGFLTEVWLTGGLLCSYCEAKQRWRVFVFSVLLYYGLNRNNLADSTPA